MMPEYAQKLQNLIEVQGTRTLRNNQHKYQCDTTIFALPQPWLGTKFHVGEPRATIAPIPLSINVATITITIALQMQRHYTRVLTLLFAITSHNLRTWYLVGRKWADMG